MWYPDPLQATKFCPGQDQKIGTVPVSFIAPGPGAMVSNDFLNFCKILLECAIECSNSPDFFLFLYCTVGTSYMVGDNRLTHSSCTIPYIQLFPSSFFSDSKLTVLCPKEATPAP
jgi:hypothetical protein